MKDLNWVNFMEVFERSHADLLESYFTAHGIKTEIIQEAYYEYQIGGAALGSIQILVPNNQLKDARKLYAESGWDFDTSEVNWETEEE